MAHLKHKTNAIERHFVGRFEKAFLVGLMGGGVVTLWSPFCLLLQKLKCFYYSTLQAIGLALAPCLVFAHLWWLFV